MPASAEEAELVAQAVLPKLKTDQQLLKLASMMASVPDLAASKLGTAIGRDEMAKLYLATIRTGGVHDYSGVGSFAQKLSAQAAQQFGARSPQAQAVEDAFTSVGMLGSDSDEGSTTFG
jgi:hypothetical protein